MSINRDVKVKARLSLIVTEMRDDNNPSGRGGRQGQGIHETYDLEEFIIDRAELNRRIIDAGDVIINGKELDNDAAPSIKTHDATAITKVQALLNAQLVAPGETSCGFVYGTTKELDNTQDCTQSPVQASTVDVSTTIAGLTPNTRYYFRAWANKAGITTRYGRMLSFKTLPV